MRMREHRAEDQVSLESVGDGSLRVVVEHSEDGHIRIRLAGQLQQETCQPVGDLAFTQMSRPDARRLTLDLSAVTFVDSQALGMLVLLSRQARERTVRLALARPRPAVLRLLEMSRLTAMFEILTTESPEETADPSAMRVPLASPPRHM